MKIYITGQIVSLDIHLNIHQNIVLKLTYKRYSKTDIKT